MECCLVMFQLELHAVCIWSIHITVLCRNIEDSEVDENDSYANIEGLVQQPDHLSRVPSQNSIKYAV